VKITVDPGTQSGKILRLAGKGLPSIDSYGKEICLSTSMYGLLKNLLKIKRLL
jgi:DnaJ-class molecular chaperone